MKVQREFPVAGTVGVLRGEAGELETLGRCLGDAEAAPDAVEVRADLCADGREALAILARLPRGLPAIFTVRLAAQGGKFRGEEGARIDLYRQALARGAALADVEWESEAARALAREGAPLITSHHDFTRTPSPAEVARLTRGMEALAPRAMKLVPKAEEIGDGVRMLEWVAAARPGGPRRVGFAMGEEGFASRVLSLAWGAPFTYGSWGQAVAPGQPSAADLKRLYRAGHLSRRTRVFGVIGNPVAHSLSPHLHNPAFAARGMDAVYLPFRLQAFAEIEGAVEALPIAGLSVTIPFKEDAARFADAPDAHARAAGAANTLVFHRQGGRREVRAHNTDFDGVLAPLARRGIDPRGLSAAVIGNGGAARGAARALLDAGARVTIYYRSAEKGRPVAAALGADSLPLSELAPGRHQLVVNATPLGLHAGDPSPVPPSVFGAATTAFDMVYDPPETAFLAAARAAGSRAIPGREMLIAQAAVQFQLFTGEEVSHEELERNFLDAVRRRQAAAGFTSA